MPQHGITVLGPKAFLVVQSKQVILKTANDMDRDTLPLIIRQNGRGINMSVVSEMAVTTDKAPTPIQMDRNTLADTSKVKSMARGFSFGKQVRSGLKINLKTCQKIGNQTPQFIKFSQF